MKTGKRLGVTVRQTWMRGMTAWRGRDIVMSVFCAAGKPSGHRQPVGIAHQALW